MILSVRMGVGADGVLADWSVAVWVRPKGAACTGIIPRDSVGTSGGRQHIDVPITVHVDPKH